MDGAIPNKLAFVNVYRVKKYNFMGVEAKTILRFRNIKRFYIVFDYLGICWDNFILK